MLFVWLLLVCFLLILYVCWYLSHHDLPHDGGEIRMEPSQQIIQQVNDIYKQIQQNTDNGNGNGNGTTNGHIHNDTIKEQPNNNNNNNNNNTTPPSISISATSPCSSIYGSRFPPSPVISSHRLTTSSDYDVIIMGGGAAGILQTLHLQLYCPGIKIAIIDPLPANRTGMAADGQWDQLDATHKIGESTVFFSGMFLVRDLNLGDYLIENHPPKYGLFYLWPKQVEQTSTWSDYYSCVSLRMPELPSFQLDRVKLERDLLARVLSDTITPVTYYQGTVKHAHLIDDDDEEEQQEKEHQTYTIMGQAAHTVDILLNNTSTNPTAKTHSTENGDGDGDGNGDEKSDSSISNRSSITLHGSHVIDCAGRAFVIGKQKKLITNKSSELMDIDNASVWIHVTDYDMNLFIGDESRGQTAASWYYATNHFCGEGYWLWVIPIETRHGRALSIGVSFHKQVHSLNQFNTQDKFLRFLEANQNILYRITMSGNIRLFKKLPRLAHVASQFYSSNNWYVMGEAAYNVDPWYSTGLTWCSFQIQHVSAIISSKLHITRAMYACQQLNKQNGMISSPMSTLSSLIDETNALTTHYNTFAGNLVRGFLLNINRHWKHLGNASIMSWRLLMETAFSPQTVVGYMSKMYLCPHGCIKSTRSTDKKIWFLSGIYDLFDELIDNKTNIGFQDYNEPGRIPFFESVHLDLLDADGSLRGGKLSFQTANMARIDAWVYLYLFWALMLLVWRGFGIRGYLKPIVYQRLGYLLYSMCVCYYRSWMWSFRNRDLITNQRFHKRKQEFTTYQGQTFVPW